EAAGVLGTSMQSVGEVMAIGGTFGEALMKGLSALELDGDLAARERRISDPVRLRQRLSTPNWERLFAVFAALRQGWTVAEVSAASSTDPGLVREIAEIAELGAGPACWNRASAPAALLARAKAAGLSAARLAALLTCREKDLAQSLADKRIARIHKRVDTCAA